MIKKIAALGLSMMITASPLFANQGAAHHGVPHLDHVFVIMMENHGYLQNINNPNEPYLNSLIASGKVNLATNYFAVGHPSLTNYLEIVGGSNFGIRSDHSPDWGNRTCSPNIEAGTVNADGSTPPQGVTLDPNSAICPISGVGKDADTPAVDDWNEVGAPFNFLADIDGVEAVHPGRTLGISIADQLTDVGLSWKSYQESLPLGGAYGVNNSNGTVSNLSDFTNLPGFSYTALYAVKHNPFAYFQSVQQGYPRNNSMNNVVGFDGPSGLFADLATGNVPSFSLIAPNQCNDQHGKSSESTFCEFDPGSDGLQAGLNPGLIQQGDVTLQRLVESIKASPVWNQGQNAIVIVWDENDYSGITNPVPAGTPFPSQNQNRVVLTVETNSTWGHNHGVQSSNYYNSFSLLRTIEAGFGLPCLNHACDRGVAVMSDLFAR